MTPEEQQKSLEEEVNQILFKDFKKFADQTRVYIAQEYITLSIVTGNQRETFALTPYLAKVLSHVLSEQVKNHIKLFAGTPFVPQKPSESKSSDPNILSPFQQSDLQNPDGNQKPDGTDTSPKDKPRGKK
jgi:hypothetical protein